MEITANSQSVAGNEKETQHTMTSEDTKTHTEKGYVSPDSNNKSETFSEWLHPKVNNVTNDWMDTDICTIETRKYKQLQHIHLC